MKNEFNKFYNALLRDIKKREKYYQQKSDNWQSSIAGDKYQYITDMLYDLKESIQMSRSYMEYFNQ